MAHDYKRNVVISPIAVQTVLTIMYNGAEGRTQAIMTKNLNFDGISPTVDVLAKAFSKLVTPILISPDIQMATGVYLNNMYPVHEVWSFEAEQQFLSQALPLNFSDSIDTAQTVNSYVDNITMNAIQNLVKPDWFHANTSAVLVNGVYMNGPWKYPFDPKLESNIYFRNDFLGCLPASKLDLMHVQVIPSL